MPGRIASAILGVMLSRSEKSAQRFYAMPWQSQHERNAYYMMKDEAGGRSTSYDLILLHQVRRK